MTVVGYLSAGARAPREHFLAAFRKGLSEMGFCEGSNVAIESRFANRVPAQLPSLVDELIRTPVNVIMASTSQAALAAKQATADIPIVFRCGGDVVGAGLVGSLAQPGGNVTGVNDYGFDLWAERLGLLHDMLPRATQIAAILGQAGEKDAVTAAANAIDLSVEFKMASTEAEIDQAFAEIAQKDALVVSQNPLFEDLRVQIVTLATHYRLPAFFAERPFCEAGGLASYGSDFDDQERLAGIWVGRILNGEKPADMRVLRPTKSDFVINRQTARCLGVEVPRSLLALANAVIE